MFRRSILALQYRDLLRFGRAGYANGSMRTVALFFSLGLTLAAEPLVIGHRGCRAVHPENTMTAFRAALAAGADILELDVVVTSDNRLVVHHDLALEGKPVRSLTLQEVKAFDRGGTPSPNFPPAAPEPGRAYSYARRSSGICPDQAGHADD